MILTILVILLVLALVGGVPAYNRSDVFPEPARENGVNSGAADTVFLSYRNTRHAWVMFCSYCQDLFGRKDRLRQLFTSQITRSSAALSAHILAVIGMGSQKQVVGSNATPHIATVKYEKPIRDCAVGKSPSDSVSTISSSEFHDVNHSVAMFIKLRLPFPAAFFWHGCLLPQATG